MNTVSDESKEKPLPVAVIEAVLKAGAQEFVICGGARNSPLIVVLAELGDKVRLWQHFDERAAGFFALGRIRATCFPVAVVTTSGTAAAELLPAMIEAHYEGLPLFALTADRPKRYRGTGAPQAIEQADLFQNYAVRFDFDRSSDLHYCDLTCTPDDKYGPIHINVCLEEPDTDETAMVRQAARSSNVNRYIGRALPDVAPAPFPPPIAERLFIVGELLEKGVPDMLLLMAYPAIVFAEAASGLWDIPALQDRLLRCGDATLRHLPIREVARLGGAPAVRWWRDLEMRPDIAVQTIHRTPYAGLARETNLLPENAEWDSSDPAPYLARDAALYARLGEILTQFPASEPALFRRLSQIISNNATVFTGNSLPIREWNLCAEYGRGHRVHVLRGANGIDGNLSAFLGIAADKAEAWCIVGDLTALYDLSAPWMLRQLPPGKRRFVVIQNGGGKIFSRLPALRELNERERALMENPHDISLRGWAEMWGMDHVSGGADLLTNSSSLAALADHAAIELYPDAGATEAFWQAWAEAEQEVWA